MTHRGSQEEGERNLLLPYRHFARLTQQPPGSSPDRFMAQTHTSLESRELRVFISSTFRDFLEERDLLAKQVFPSLNRRARERGVEVVDVDLRWGITQEESEQGKVIGICLAEIERCRPYFIGMLGERYGWTPSPDTYPADLIEREELQWLKDHQGGASVTELEILHGVLNNQGMADRAFFYFRDPAWSREQRELGFVCDTAEEEAKLSDLKERISNSGFPVRKNLADPQAIAERIEADLWALIGEQFPEADPPDALEQEERKHAAYRQLRTGLYLGGKGYVQQLERWIDAGEQKILIRGASGAGKSALLANWIKRHEQLHPEDLVYGHHLGCSNDANALRPLLGRLIDTASQLLADELREPFKVPNDWWELTAKVAEVLWQISSRCQRRGHRWIWVLDGLDRLDAGDQQALPWLPMTLPPGVVLVTSALDCPACTILLKREFNTLTIGPLRRPEQENMIQRYLVRYTKQLDVGLRETILAHPLAESPLFLRVLLEELRQCGRFEMLSQQLAFYLSAKTVDDLYERVLERLEQDGHGAALRQVMTALWASRAGLSESELLAITGLAPLQWAPIDLALEQAFGHNGNQLVFDHDYLQQAVEDRYLADEEQKRTAHSDLADWFADREGWDKRDAEEWPWQLLHANRLSELRSLILNVGFLARLVGSRSSREALGYWSAARAEDDGELDELIADEVEAVMNQRQEEREGLIRFADKIATLLDEAGLNRELLLKLRKCSFDLEEGCEAANLKGLHNIAQCYQMQGNHDQAKKLFKRCLEVRELQLGAEHPSTLTAVAGLAGIYKEQGNFEKAQDLYSRCHRARKRLLGSEHPSTLITLGNLAGLSRDQDELKQNNEVYRRLLETFERVLGPEHPYTLTTINNLAGSCQDLGDYEQAEALYERCLEADERIHGAAHPSTLATAGNLATLYQERKNYKQAMALYKRCLEADERIRGFDHPWTLVSAGNLATLYQERKDYKQAEALYKRALEARERLLGTEHRSTITTVYNLASVYKAQGNYGQAEALYKRALEARERLLGTEHRSTITTVYNLASVYKAQGNYGQAEALYKRALEARERLLGTEHRSTITTIYNLASVYKAQGDYGQAEALYKRALEARERLLGTEHRSTITTVYNLASVYKAQGNYGQAEALYKRALEVRERLLGAEHPGTLAVAYTFAEALSAQGRYAEAISLYRRELSWCRLQNGETDSGTLKSINSLAIALRETGELEEAEMLFRELLASRQQVLKPGNFGIGRALGGLAKTLEMAGKLREAIETRQQALEHRFQHEGPNSWYTNNDRLALARLLHMLGRDPEVLPLLAEIHSSMDSNSEPDDDDRQLLADAAELRAAIEHQP